MTDDQHGEGAAPHSGGRWDPLPQGDYDDGATAFVKLPEGGIDALLASDSPLAAPGHGYVPPQITVAPGGAADTDPAATGTWAAAPAGGAQWPDPNAVPQDGHTAGNDQFTYNPGATGQWTFQDASDSAPAPGHDVTGQWSIPVAGGDLPDESGEFTTSSLVEQWGGGTPPATLPGGAPAPWATQTGQPWDTGAVDAGQPTPPGAEHGHAHVPADDGHGLPAGDEHVHGPSGAVGDAAAADVHARVEAGPDESAPDVERASAEPQDHPSDAAPAAAASPPSPGDGEDAAASEAPEDAQGAVEAAEEAPEPPAEHTPDGDTAPAAEDTEEHAAEQPPAFPGEEHPLAAYVLRVNGVDRPVADAWIGESLLYVLRERLGLAGAKDGCSQGECGACNVQVDGRLVASCLVPAVTAAGSEVRTVEGLAEDGRPSDVQRALARCGAVQCGFCVPGMAMTVHDLLEGNPAPTELETRQALCGNLCRCSGYRGVVDAVQEVVAEREAHAAADSESDGDEARIPHQAGPGAGGVNPSAFEPRHDQAYGPDGGQA
ncbi:2Fe-2S iron-sulfur cluster-binding protein [Streptomyces justiciae]|uniref:2Fe-2S iron-sulfur cluster-binding protein n=1 Tax=Streptomyces justiciae TaxID=2780140 RepID=UPI002118F423|nr:2Fe-2S iron-sulfur cluster-binding protein [Streptomyces justiciae]MCW8381618.1 2Fe-2S iron-sulfur cluster-binding protein [Streptomyces justiciae]